MDLLLIDVLTVALVLVVSALPVVWLRQTLGFLFTVFSPGYVLVAVLFPGKHSLSVTNRVALSLGLSISVVVFIGLMLSYSPWGIGLYPLLLSVSLFILLGSGFAWYARERVGLRERFDVRVYLPLVSLGYLLRNTGKKYCSSIIILLCVILGSGVALGYVTTKPLARQAFTEFYILGSEGTAEYYPRELHPGQLGKVIVHIVNHEQEETDYRLELVVDNHKLYESVPRRLKPEEKWEETIDFVIQKVADNQKVEFLLYQGGGRPREIRYLWVNVKE